jgi:hypothetical protein
LRAITGIPPLRRQLALESLAALVGNGLVAPLKKLFELRDVNARVAGCALNEAQNGRAFARNRDRLRWSLDCKLVHHANSGFGHLS